MSWTQNKIYRNLVHNLSATSNVCVGHKLDSVATAMHTLYSQRRITSMAQSIVMLADEESSL